MFLSCLNATYYISIKKFKKIGALKKLQLKIHLSMCEACHDFDHQNQIIDKTMQKFSNATEFLENENLSEDKKSEIKAIVNQHNR